MVEKGKPSGTSHTEYSRAAFLMKRMLRPSSYARGLEALRDVPQWRRINRLVAERVTELGENFSLVQIGANDGQRADPVHHLIKTHRIQALLVEPVPRYFDALQNTYNADSHVRFADVAVSDHDGVATMHAVLPSDGGSSRLQGCSSFDREVIDDAAWVVKTVDPLVQQVQVPTVRLETLLKTHNVPRLDYLVVDTEGHDKVIIDQLEQLGPKYQPTFILYEHNHLSRLDKATLERSLMDRGYILYPLRRDTFAYKPGTPDQSEPQ